MEIPQNAEEYRAAMLEYGSRSCTKSMFQGYLYRFLSELFRDDDAGLSKRYADLNDYEMAHLTTYQAKDHDSPAHQSSCYKYSELQSIVDQPPLQDKQGQVLFLRGHLSGSWIAAIGAKYSIAPEFFRRHIHVWRSLGGPVLYHVPRLPSATCGGLSLRINTLGYSMIPFVGLSLSSRLKVLPDLIELNPTRLMAAPGSSYVRGHAYLSELQFLIEQDISITVQATGIGWTAIAWSDVGSRGLSNSLDFHRFIDHLTACSKTGFRNIRLIAASLVGKESQLHHPLHPLPPDSPTSPPTDHSLIQSAAHLPSESHLLLDHALAALDPLYALTPLFTFAAATENGLLGSIHKRYELISATAWNPKHGKEYMEQLILHKHILDDHACRHEEVLRFLNAEHFKTWPSMKKTTPQQRSVADKAKREVKEDYAYLLARCRQISLHHQEAISILTSTSALAESRKQIDLATQVTKLTVLASVFLPLSFCTGIFGMNFVELEGLRIWIWAVVTVLIGGVTVGVYGWDRRGVVEDGMRRVWGRVKVRRARWGYGGEGLA